MVYKYFSIFLLACLPLGSAHADAALVAAIGDYIARKGDTSPLEYKHAFVDLNDDQRQDAVVLLQSPFWCGNAGCRLLVFEGKGEAYELHATSTISRAPIRISAQKSHGWHTLIVNTKGAGDVLMVHDRKHYPANPSLQKPASKSQLDAARTLID